MLIMTAQKPRYPFIELSGDSQIIEKGYGRFGTSLPKGGITETQFRNKLSSVITVQDIKTKFMNKCFFEIDLRLNYYESVPQSLFKQLGVEVRTVFPNKTGLKKVIVSGDADTIEKYKTKSKINKSFPFCIEDIKLIDSDKKIGESIKELLEKNRDTKVDISFISKITAQEIQALDESIPEIKKKITFNKYTSTGNAILTKPEVQKLSEIPIVKRISEPANWKGSFIARGASISDDFRISLPSNLDQLPSVCVIDTGISEKLKDYTEQYAISDLNPFDIDGHGSSVSSLCMFGRNELIGSNNLTPSVKVISHKISEKIETNDINFFEELLKAMDQHKNLTRIFCLSWNCIFYDDISYEDRLKEIDEYMQKNNILLINSAGNLSRDEVAPIVEEYPKYLLENPVMTPSESKLVFSIGSVHKISDYKTILSPFTRTLLPLNLVNRMEDLHIRIKPELFAEGGFIEYGPTRTDDTIKGIICLDSNCVKKASVGTSLSAPQVARAASFLMDYYPMNYVESVKAMLFLKSNFFTQIEPKLDFRYQGKTLFDDAVLLDADNGFYFFFEDEVGLKQRIQEEKKDKVYAKKWSFPVPKEIDTVEFAIYHSNTNTIEDIRTISTRIRAIIHKPGCKNPLNKNYEDGFGTMGFYVPLTHGRYRPTRNTPEDMWSITTCAETRGVPQFMMGEIKVRYGIAIKLNIKSEYLENKDAIYAKILKMIGEDASDYEEKIVESQIVEIPASDEISI